MKNTVNESTKTTKKRPGKKKNFRRLFYFSFLLTIILLIVLYFLNIMPLLYFGILSLILVGYDFFMFSFMKKKNWKKRLFGSIFTILKIVGTIIVLVYFIHTLLFLNKINDGNYNTENYSVVVLNSSNYYKLKDIKDKK